MKKSGALLLAVLLFATMAACMGTAASTDMTPAQMTQSLAELLSLDDLIEGSERWFSEYYRFDTSVIQSWSARIYGSGANANELFVAEFTSSQAARDSDDVFTKHAEKIIDYYNGYLPLEHAKAQNYQTLVKGRYVLFVIADDPQTALTAFEGFFS